MGGYAVGVVLSTKRVLELASMWGVPESQVDGVSIDLSLSPEIMHIPYYGKRKVVNLDQEDYVFVPDGYYLGSSREYIELPSTVMAMLSTRSTVARMGIWHATASDIKPGFRGNIVFEFEVKRPVKIPAGSRLFQITLLSLAGESKYNGRYQSQSGLVYPVDTEVVHVEEEL